MATASFRTLPPPPHSEDTMDVSSPERRVLDDDIDIDLDDYPAAVNDAQTDEDMLDESVNNDEATLDDLMLDDEQTSTNNQPPRPHIFTLPEDDLIDYSDEEEYQNLLTPVVTKPPTILAIPTLHTDVSHPQTTTSTSQILDTPADQDISEDETHPSQQKKARDTAAAGKADDAEPLLDFDEPDNLAETAEAEVLQENDHEPENSAPVEADVSTSATAVDNKTPLAPHSIHDQSSAATEVSKDAEAATYDDEQDEPHEQIVNPEEQVVVADRAGTPTDTGLHPVVLYFFDHAFPLFKSKTSPDGLLNDDNLVSVSLADFIKACKQRLALKTDHEISENYEIFLTFEDLYLTVVEDSAPSFQISLKEVLDVYVQLHENDGLGGDEIPVLDITCSLQVKFNSSIEILQKAASTGDGMSNFASTLYDETDDIQHDDLNSDADDVFNNNEAVADSTHKDDDQAHDETGDVTTLATETNGQTEDPEADTHGESGWNHEEGEDVLEEYNDQEYEYVEDDQEDHHNAELQESHNVEQDVTEEHQYSTSADEGQSAHARAAAATNQNGTVQADGAVIDHGHQANHTESAQLHDHKSENAKEPDHSSGKRAANGTVDLAKFTKELAKDHNNKDEVEFELEDDLLTELVESASSTSAKVAPTKRGRDVSDEEELNDTKRQRSTK